MSIVPAARFLAEFHSANDNKSVRSEGVADTARRTSSLTEAALEAQLAEAYTRGWEAGREAERSALTAKLEQSTADFQERLRGEREAWVAEEGAKLAQGLARGLTDLEQRVGEAVALLLGPFLTVAAREKAVAELGRQIRTLVAGDSAVALSISGPADLLQAVRSALPCGLNVVDFEENDDCEVRVRADGTLIETRLRGWLEGLREVVR